VFVFNTELTLLVDFLKKYVSNKKTKDRSTTLDDQRIHEPSHWPRGVPHHLNKDTLEGGD